MSALEVYKLDSVRVFPDGQSFEIAAPDLAKEWGYREAKDITRLLDDTEKGRRKVPTPGGAQTINVVNEKGFNRLVSTLRRPELKTWQDRLYGEIIPQWTRTGVAVDTARVDLTDPVMVLELASRAGEIAKEFRQRAEVAEARVLELEAPAAAFDAYLESAGELNFRRVMQIVRQISPEIKEHTVTGMLRAGGHVERWSFTATARAVHAGHMRNKGVALRNGGTATQGLFTPSGVRWLLKLVLGDGDARRVPDSLLDEMAGELV